jgi:hypothetical protein
MRRAPDVDEGLAARRQHVPRRVERRRGELLPAHCRARACVRARACACARVAAPRMVSADAMERASHSRTCTPSGRTLRSYVAARCATLRRVVFPRPTAAPCTIRTAMPAAPPSAGRAHGARVCVVRVCARARVRVCEGLPSDRAIGRAAQHDVRFGGREAHRVHCVLMALHRRPLKTGSFLRCVSTCVCARAFVYARARVSGLKHLKGSDVRQ